MKVIQKNYMLIIKILLKDVKIGENILVDDGKIIFEVLETDNKTEVKVKTIQGGKLKSRRNKSAQY